MRHPAGYTKTAAIGCPDRAESGIRPMLITLQNLLNKSRGLDFLAPLAMRLFLAPVFWMAGTRKLENMEGTIAWFDHSLGMPFPQLMAYLATVTEIIGAIALLLGLGVRWASIPLMVTMIVAAVTVHWQNGWSIIASGAGLFASERTMGAIERLDRAKSLLQEYGNYDWLTENGSLVMLNNGIEYAAIYFIMLLTLFFTGAGRYLSIDFWIARRFMPAP